MRRAGLLVRQRHDLAQQGHPSHLETQVGGQPSADPSGECEPDALQDLAQPRGEARVRGGQLSERLGEVRRGQLSVLQMKRRTVRWNTTFCSASGRSFSLRW